MGLGGGEWGPAVIMLERAILNPKWAVLLDNQYPR